MPVDQKSGEIVKEQDYINELSLNFKKRFPMIDLVGSLARSNVLKPGKDLITFVEKNRDFDPGKTPVSQYLAEAGIDELFKQELQEIKDEKKREERQHEQHAFVRELRYLQFVYTFSPEKNRTACAAALLSFEIELHGYQPLIPSGDTTDIKESPTTSSGAGKKGPASSISKRVFLDEDFYKKTLKYLQDGEIPDMPFTFKRKASVHTYKLKADSAVKIVSINKTDFITRWKEIRESQGEKDPDTIRYEAEEIYNRTSYQAF